MLYTIGNRSEPDRAGSTTPGAPVTVFPVRRPTLIHCAGHPTLVILCGTHIVTINPFPVRHSASDYSFATYPLPPE